MFEKTKNKCFNVWEDEEYLNVWEDEEYLNVWEDEES